MGHKIKFGGVENPPRQKQETETTPQAVPEVDKQTPQVVRKSSMDQVLETLGVDHAVEVLTKALVDEVSYSEFIDMINRLNKSGERVTQREISEAIRRSNKPLPPNYTEFKNFLKGLKEE